MKLKKDKILFIKHKSFNAQTVNNDFEILSDKFDVIYYNVNTTNNALIIFALLKQASYLILFGFRYKLFYIWFCDYHSLLPVFFGKLFNIKSVINVGGYDATDIPEIKCGAFNRDNLKGKLRAYFLEYSYKNCDYIITVDDSLIKNENSYIYSDNKEKKVLSDGILNYIPGLKTPINTVYTCYDTDFFLPGEDTRKEKMVLSVGLTPNENEFKRKGFDVLVEAAKEMSDVQFVLIGVSEDQCAFLKTLNLSNLTFKTKLPRKELLILFQKAKVFAQLSLFEGLPNTLCEAMLCGCVPVGSNVNGIPKAMGDNGFIVYKKDLKEVKEKLYSALGTTDEEGRKARNYIVSSFTFQKRKNDIYSIINTLIRK